MKYMGIDFGSKRIGVALSDGGNVFALPYGVIQNDKNAVEAIRKIVETHKVTHVVIGDSKNYKGVENTIMKKAKVFAKKIEELTHVRVSWEPEFLTSAEAEHIQGKTENLDASAAALILKSYLDKKHDPVRNNSVMNN